MIEKIKGGDISSPEALQQQRLREALLVSAEMYGLDVSASWLEVLNEMRKQLPEIEGLEASAQPLPAEVQERYRQKTTSLYDLSPQTTYEEAHMVDAFARDEVLRQDWAIYLQLLPTVSWDEIMESCPEEIEILRPMYRYRRIDTSAS